MGDYKDVINPHTGNLQRLLNSDTVDEFRTNINNILNELIDNATNVNNIFDELMNNAMEIEELSAGVTLDMINGFRDSYEDESGIDTVNSINQLYDSVNDYYNPTGGYTSDTKLMLHLDGEDGATSTIDDSPAEHTINLTGNAELDTAYKKYGTASCLFNAPSEISIADSSDWDFCASTEDNWTIQWFVYHTDISGTRDYIRQEETNTDKFTIRINGNTSIIIFMRTTGDGYSFNFSTSTGLLSINTWHHMTFIKVGSEIGFYIDGIQRAYSTMSFATTFSAPLTFGRNIAGNMDEIRIDNSNLFLASPNAGLTDTITVPSSAYSSFKDNMTLISENFSVDTAPSSARLLFKIEEGEESLILNTDITFELSRDNGTTFTQGTPELIRTIGSNKMIGVDVDLSSQPSGTDLKYRLKSLTNKDFYAKAVACQIKA